MSFACLTSVFVLIPLGFPILYRGYDSKALCSKGSSNLIQYTALATGRPFGNNADVASCDDESYTINFSEGQGDGGAVFDYTLFYEYTNCEDGDDDGEDADHSAEVIAESISCVHRFDSRNDVDDDDDPMFVIGDIVYSVGHLFGIV